MFNILRSFLTVLIISQAAPLLADIGIVDSVSLKMAVLYEEDSQVYRKMCVPPVTPPLTRACDSNEAPLALAADVYLQRLPYETGNYPRTEQGLQIATRALQDAIQNGAGSAVIARLQSINNNLRTILGIRANLAAEQQNLTYYEYQDGFKTLRLPFDPNYAEYDFSNPFDPADPQAAGQIAALRAWREGYSSLEIKPGVEVKPVRSEWDASQGQFIYEYMLTKGKLRCEFISYDSVVHQGHRIFFDNDSLNELVTSLFFEFEGPLGNRGRVISMLRCDVPYFYKGKTGSRDFTVDELERMFEHSVLTRNR